jgi:hypothetical protein
MHNLQATYLPHNLVEHSYICPKGYRFCPGVKPTLDVARNSAMT